MFPKLSSIPARALAAALLAATLAACQPAASPTPFGAVRVSTSLVDPEIVRVTATLSGPLLPQIVYDLTMAADGSWSTTIEGLPPGGIQASVAALDAAGVVRFTGSGNTTIVAGAVAGLEIFAQEVSPPPSFGNTPPRIDAIGVSSLTVSPGSALSFTVTASDPDAGAVLSYLWTATGGAFANPTTATTSWAAPATEGPQTITVRVEDEKGASTTASFAVSVLTAPPTTGGIALTVRLNHAPVVTDIVLAPTRVLPGESTALVAAVLDADADPLSFSWTSTCGGAFSAPTAAATSFTPFPTSAEALCTLYLRADDGHGGVAVGWTGLWVGPPPPVGGPLPPPPPPPTTGGILNGGFETGDYTGWLPSSDGLAPGRHAWGIGRPGMAIVPGMPVHDFETGTDVVFSSVAAVPLSVSPFEGVASAFLISEAPGSFALSQPVTIPASGGFSTLALSYGAEQPWEPGVQELAVEVRSMDGLVLGTIFRTAFEGPGPRPWRMIEFSVAPWVGQTVVLSVTVVSHLGPVWAQVDAVALR